MNNGIKNNPYITSVNPYDDMDIRIDMDRLKELLNAIPWQDSDIRYVAFYHLGHGFLGKKDVFDLATSYVVNLLDRTEKDALSEAQAFELGKNAQDNECEPISALEGYARDFSLHASGANKKQFSKSLEQLSKEIPQLKHVKDILSQETMAVHQKNLEELQPKDVYRADKVYLRDMQQDSLRVIYFLIYYTGDEPKEKNKRSELLDKAKNIYDLLPKKLIQPTFYALYNYCHETRGEGFTAHNFFNWAKECDKVLSDPIQFAELEAALENLPADRQLTGFEQAFRRMDHVINCAKRAYGLEIVNKFKESINKDFDHEKTLACTAPETTDKEIASNIEEMNKLFAVTQSDSSLHNLDILENALLGFHDDFDADSKRQSFVSTGHYSLDASIRGYKRGGVTVFAAYSGWGKTWWGIDAMRLVAISMSEKGINAHTMFYSCEMPTSEISKRLALNVCGFNIADVKCLSENGAMEQHLKNGFINFMGNFKPRMSLCGAPNCEFTTLKNAVKSEIERNGDLDLLVIDFYQLLEADYLRPGTTKYEQLKDIAQKLVQLARQIDCPILLLTQLNSPKNNYTEKNEPGLYNIADCTTMGTLAEAVLVAFSKVETLRPQEYMPQDYISIAKNRHGSAVSSIETQFKCGRYAGGQFRLYSCES